MPYPHKKLFKMKEVAERKPILVSAEIVNLEVKVLKNYPT